MRRTAAVKPPANPVAKPKSLAQAHSDFTSEGAPLPGMVAASTPPAKNTDAKPNPSGGKSDA